MKYNSSTYKKHDDVESVKAELYRQRDAQIAKWHANATHGLSLGSDEKPLGDMTHAGPIHSHGVAEGLNLALTHLELLPGGQLR